MKNWNTMIFVWFLCDIDVCIFVSCWEVKSLHYMFEKAFRGVVGLAAIGLVEKCGTNH